MEELDVTHGVVFRVLEPFGGVIRVENWTPSEARLSLEERIEIKLGVERGWSLRKIGHSIGRHASTVCRELAANGGHEHYRPMPAHARAGKAARRPKATKLATNAALRERVTRDLEHLWSPMQISKRLRCGFADEPTMSISHETIYKSLYVQGRGELRKELARCLRTGRRKRRPRGRSETRGTIPDMVMISDRPPEVEDRAVPGHWEGDLILGDNNRSAIGTLVERTTRVLMLLHLPSDRKPETVRQAMTEAIKTLPEALRRSITWDQGKEISEHVRFTVDTGVQVYFCDPHSPWQRGSNENTNGLLRQYFPKGTDLSVHTQQDLEAVADSLNGRPRQTLGWMTPSEKFAEVVASTG
jgi:IS30 family transposase